MKKITLDQSEIETLLNLIPEDATQERRVFEYIAARIDSVTVNVNQATSTGNLSHVVRKLNRKIYSKHLMIACQRPIVPVQNKFGESSQMFIWSLYRIPNEGRAANDSKANEQAS